MEKFIGDEKISYSSIASISNNWVEHNGVLFSWKQIWNIYNTQFSFINPTNEQYSGGNEGRLIARYQIQNYESHTRTIEMYDHKWNLVYEYKITQFLKSINIHVTESDKLVVLTNKCELSTFFAGRNVSIEKISNSEVIASEIWDNGLVYLTENKEVYYAPFYKDPQLLYTIDISCNFPIIRVIPPEYTSNDSPVVFISDFSSDLIVVVKDNSWTIPFPAGIMDFKFSPNYSLCAFLYQNESDLWLAITESNPSERLLTVSLPSSDDAVLQLSWVGNDFPLISFEKSIQIVFSSGEVFEIKEKNYSLQGPKVVISCFESALIFSSGNLFHLKLVDDDFKELLSPNSYPSELVLSFEHRDLDKISNLKNQNSLDIAIDTCIKCSQRCEQPLRQKILMYSALYGRSFLDMSYKSEMFYDTSQKLRVCNAFQKELNILLSPICLFDELSKPDLILRICNRQKFGLAIKIADYLSFDKRAIMTEWCLSMAYNIFDDEIAFKIISSKKDENFEINEIATALYKENRVELAKQVASLETSTSRVVPFYLQSKMWEDAIDAAIKSSDSTLFIEVINKALAENLNDLVTEVVGRDFVTYSAVAKMIGQKAITENQEFVGLNKLYYEIIQKNSEKYIPDNLITYQNKLQIRTGKFEDNLKKHYEKSLDSKTINSKCESYILAQCDPKDVKTITDFANKMNIDQKKFFIMVGTVLSQHKEWDRFRFLVNDDYRSYWHYYALMAFYTFGKDKALDFASLISDPEQSEKIKKMLELSPKKAYQAFTQIKNESVLKKAIKKNLIDRIKH